MDDQVAMDERLDIFDADFRPLGTATRRVVHEQGLWHQTFHCWHVRMDAETPLLLLQQRHHLKQANPGKFDTSVAGHLLAGESVSDGVRECEEELGVPVRAEDLRRIGVFRESFAADGLLDNEFSHVFVTIGDHSLLEYRPALDEVAGLYEIYLPDLQRLYQAFDSVLVHGVRYDAMGGTPNTVTIGPMDIVRRSPAYLTALWAYLGGL